MSGFILPELIAWVGKSGRPAFLGFFTVNIHNRNIRAAYAQAAGHFLAMIGDSPARKELRVAPSNL